MVQQRGNGTKPLDETEEAAEEQTESEGSERAAQVSMTHETALSCLAKLSFSLRLFCISAKV